MPESWKILGPTWAKNRSWTSFSTHLEPSGMSETYSQCIFCAGWDRQCSEWPQNGPKINRFPLQSGWLREVKFIRSASLDSDQLDFKIPSEFIQKYAKQGSWLAWGPTVHVSLTVKNILLALALGTFLMESKSWPWNGHFQVERQTDNMDLHKKCPRIQLE